MKRIALIADYDPNSETHLATEQAIFHSADHLGICTKSVWIGTEDILPDIFQDFDGVWVGTGSPYRNINNVLYAIEYARKNDFPIFATCGGFQHMILEIGRNELNFPYAAHAEYDSHSSPQFIVPLICSLRGREMHIKLTPESKVAHLYGSAEVTEKYYCNFGVNPEYVELIRASSLRIVGSDSEGELRVVEAPQHRFFVGTLFVPQASSKVGIPHPLVNGFLRAVDRFRG